MFLAAGSSVNKQAPFVQLSLGRILPVHVRYALVLF
jgi:hypothetical protein